MEGNYNIEIYNKRLHFKLCVKRKITVLCSDSATGKTTLINMIGEFNESGGQTGIHIECSKKCIVLNGQDWRDKLNRISNSIVFIDNWNEFISSKEFIEAIQNTNNYYVIATRIKLKALEYDTINNSLIQ